MAKRRNHNGAADGHAAAKPAEATAAYFLSLTLRNIRCFGDEPQSLDLSDGNGRPARWTVLLGNNGTGKTTLLQVLASCELYPLTAGSNKDQITPAGWAPRWLSVHGTGVSFSRDRAQQTNLSASLFRGRAFDHGADAHVTVDIRCGISAEDRHTASIHEEFVGLKCYGYGASRRFSLKGLAEAEADDATASLFSDDANLRNAEDWLLRLDYAAKASEQSLVREHQARQRDLITALLIEILPEVDEIRFDPGAGTHPSPKVEAKTPYGWVAFRQLGHGYRTLIAWMVDLVSRLVERYPESPNPLEAPAVVLVDEIDLHMHPEWQRKVMSKLTESFPNTQFIVTAHSPLIVQAAAEDANLALLRREGDHVIIDNDVGYIRGWDVDLLLVSDLFGLPSSRPPQYDAIFERRKKLLGKSKLTPKEKQELAELNEKVFQLPFGETADQAKTIDLIQKTLKRLEERERQAQ
jgi:hypothetical protein